MTATGDWVSVDRERILATAEGLQPTPEQMQGRCLLPTTAGRGSLQLKDCREGKIVLKVVRKGDPPPSPSWV